MIVAIIILSILFILAVVAAILFYLVGKSALLELTDRSKPERQDYKRWFNENIAEEFPCILMIDSVAAPGEKNYCDFSLYKKYGIIGYSNCSPKEKQPVNLIPN